MKDPNQKESERAELVRVILVTFPDMDCARQIGTLLVESQLIACINLIPSVESIYRWEGKVNSDSEVLGIMKTKSTAINNLKAKFVEAHPYEVPEFIVLEPSEGLDSYLKWVCGEVGI